MEFTISNLDQFNFTMNNVVFQQNAVCMSIKSRASMDISINITNSTFIQNGNGDSFTTGYPSILWLNSKKNKINIQLRNCTFNKNTFNEYGMMVDVENKEGVTNLFLDQFTFEENGHIGTVSGVPHGILSLQSAVVIMTLEFGFVYSTFGTFLTVFGQTAQINILNTEVDKFYNPNPGGGVVNTNASVTGFLAIKDSCFRNGKSDWWGGVVSIIVPNLLMTIQSCVFQNISSHVVGGAVYVQSYDLFKSPNSSNDFVTELNINNSSFSNCVSGDGGAVYILVEKFFASITDSLFLQNIANTSGGAEVFIAFNNAIIRLHNVRFVENIAADGGIIIVTTKSKESSITFTTSNVSLIRNKLHTQQAHFSAILYLWIKSKISSVVFKSTRVIRNIGIGSNSILVELNSPTSSHSIALDTCIFRGNIANVGSLFDYGQGTLICKHSIFDSNNGFVCQQSYGFFATMNNSKITITNSTFVNNSCGAASLFINMKSHVKIEHTKFVRNQAVGSAGGAMYISIFSTNDNDLKQTHINRSENLHRYNVLIENGWFQENIATTGGALTVVNGKVKVQNCVFVNNFARLHGGQITSFGSTDIKIHYSVLKQTIQKIITNKTEFTASSFLRTYSTGELQLRHTIIDLKTISDEPLILATRTDRVNISEDSLITCPLGSVLKKSLYHYKDSDRRVVTVLDLSCEACDYNFYSLQRGHAKGLNVDSSFICMPCPRGANCIPTIKSKPNFWGYNASFDPPTLAFTPCPFGYCKSPQANSSKYNDCIGKRTGVMCGSCSDGYTEALWSTYCTSNKDCNDYWFWILFLALALFMAILLVCKPPVIMNSLKHVLWFRRFTTNFANSPRFRSHSMIHSLSSYEEDKPDNIPLSSTEQLKHHKRQFSGFLEIIFYFYQIAQLLISSYSLGEFFDSKILPPVLGFFNFEPRLPKRVFLCPFPGLTPKTKLAFKILPVLGTLLAIFNIYLFHVFSNKLRRLPRPSLSSYLQASIKTIFLGYTTLATVGISLIRCVSVAGEDRWFYNGNVICYQWWQYVSFAFNGIFVIPFIFVLAWASFKVHHGTITVRQFLLAIAFPLPFSLLWLFLIVCPSEGVDAEESETFGAIKEMILGPYKEPGNGSNHGAVCWQSVLIARRFVLVLIFCTVAEPSIRLFCMTLACVFVLFLHLKVKPFRNSLANNLESFALLLLIALGLINLFKSVFAGIEENVKGPLVTVFKVFQWLEIVILGLFPALLSLLVCLAILSLILRVLLMCCRSLFKCIFTCSAQRWLSQDQSRLENFCEDIDD